jgi:hypothetical protein
MAKRSSGSWFDYWFSSDRPARPGTRGRSGGRSRGSSGAGSLSWWFEPVGGRRPARGSGGIGGGGRTRRPRVEEGRHCPICGKAARCRCRAADGEPIRRKRAPRGGYGVPPDFRAYGAVWCGGCRHRINTYTGKCMNTKCSR